MRHRMLLLWTVGFAAGIGAGTALGGALGLWMGLGALGLCLLVAGGRWWALTAAGVVLAGLGAGAVRLAAFQNVQASDVSRLAGRVAPVSVTGTVVSDPEQRRGGRVTLVLRAERVRRYDGVSAVTGEAYVTLEPDAQTPDTALDYGDRVTLDGRLEVPAGATNPGAFSWRDYLARRDVYCELRVKRPGAITKLGGSALNPFLRLAWATRRCVLGAVHAVLPVTQAAVLSGILLGRRTDLPPDLMADFVHTGTVHILASAGLHVGVVAFWTLFLCERLTLPRKASAGAIIGTLWLYALMAGGRPSVTRAVVMATLYFGAILFEREPDLPTTLAAAALLILLVQPTALWESGFQLSFLTVLTLTAGMPVWQAWWRPRVGRISRPLPRRVLWWAVEMAGLSLLAQVGAAPVVASDYNEISLSGFFANALVVPALFGLIPLGFLGAALWGLGHALGGALLALTGLGLRYVTTVVRLFGESPLASRAVVTPSPMLMVLYYGVVFGLAALLTRTFAPSYSSVPCPGSERGGGTGKPKCS